VNRTLWLTPALVLWPALAHGQTPAAPPPPPPAPAPVYAPPPAPYGYGYGYGYAPPPYYGYPPYVPSYAAAKPVTVRTVPYNGGPVPDGATLKTKRSNVLLGAGLITMGSLYVISAVYAMAACSPGDSAESCPSNTAWLYLPVAGPFIAAASPEASYGGRNLAIFDGAFQAAGLITAIAVLATSEDVLEYRDTPVGRVSIRPSAPAALAGASVRVTSF
jgi:hypothetical protein